MRARLMRMAGGLALLLALLAGALSTPAAAMSDDAVGEASAPKAMEAPAQKLELSWPVDQITIETPPDYTGRLMSVEMAITPRQRQVGLMFRKTMPKDHGMLFVFDREEPQAFWMKNTYIALDMVFIDSAGVVVHVHEGAKPLDETVIHSQKPALAVLEVNAGEAAHLGLVTGSRIGHPVFQEKSGH